MTTRRVSKNVTKIETRSGDCHWTSHAVEWVADESGDYVEVSRPDSKSYVHVLDWDRFVRNYLKFAA